MAEEGTVRKPRIAVLSMVQWAAAKKDLCYHTDDHGPRGVQGEIAQAGTGLGLSMWLVYRGEHILYECTKYKSIRDQLRECALIEGMAWPSQLEF